jgi:predicted nuclease of predicted toxin-antitoxin system
MKFLVDAQLPPGLCRWLEGRGHQADHVNDLGLGTVADTAIAERAENEGAILISKDEDFLILRLPDRFPFLWLRCGNSTNRALAAWMEDRWDWVEKLLAGGERVIELR